MKKLLIVLALCVFAVSCCEVDHNNSQEKKPTKITATSFKVYKESGAVVNERMYYYVLDALDSNKDITLTSILGVEVSRCNDLTKEQLEQVFDYLVEKELE